MVAPCVPVTSPDKLPENEVAVAAFPPMFNADAVPVNPVPIPEKLVAVNTPVLGTNDNLVLVTFCGKLPVLAVTKVG